MPSTGITYRPIIADFITTSYRAVGTILVPPSGLMGTMNDINSSFVEVQNVQLARLHTPNQIVERYEMIRLVKSHILAVCAGRRDDLGSGAMARTSLGQVVEYPVFLTCGDYEFDATLEWSGRFNFGSILAESIQGFVPFFRVSITGVIFPAMQIDSPAVLVNGAHIEMIALATQHKGLEA